MFRPGAKRRAARAFMGRDTGRGMGTALKRLGLVQAWP